MANFLDMNGVDSGLTKDEFLNGPRDAIKLEARRRILKAVPEWKQRNAAIDIHSTDADVKAKAQTVIDAVNALRTKSNEIEAALPDKTDEEIWYFDASDDAHWS